MRILGVDPGSRLLGYGCVDYLGNRFQHVTHGTLRIAVGTGENAISFEDRLLRIYQQLSEIILEFKPKIMVVEKVFFAKNALSALKLGQARGAILLTAKIHQIEICEYSATAVKLAVTGHGQADKEQVAKMVQLIVGNAKGPGSAKPLKFPTFDASDGLALAICHGQNSRNLTRTNSSNAGLQSLSTQRTKKRMSLAECVGIAPVKK